jgi:N-acetylglucosamine-6-phosphate deacetylase|tara:strand:+ start:2818 stop:3948 length:1131 start_codon:yes stop_codon:yes gene_type:complete
MMEKGTAYIGADIHDGSSLYTGMALTIGVDDTIDIASVQDISSKWTVQHLDGGIIQPGYVDLQVNGGGGVMFNDDQSVDALRTIALAHARCGTCAILPTLITDTFPKTAAAIDAVALAIQLGVPGIIGIHLEGPHLSITRKGAHDASLIRPMCNVDLDLLLSAAARIPNVMITVAPENTNLTQIRSLVDAGVTVSLGHTDATYDTCMSAFDAGARCVTHLFNAMSQLGNREPGLVGAALVRDDVHTGLIADGIHVHPATIRTAVAAKGGKLFLVSDAMATAGSHIDGFELNGRWVGRENGRLTLGNGTLAGADLDLTRAVQVMRQDAGDTHAAAIARATSTPTKLLTKNDRWGTFGAGPKSLIYVNKVMSACPLVS